MKALVVGDPHLQFQRPDENRKFIDKLLEISAEENNCYSTVILLGDLFHTFSVLRSEVLSEWNRLFKQIQKKVITLVGNHDYASQAGGIHALEVFKDVPRGIHIVDSITCIDGIYYAPFFRDDKAFEQECLKFPIGSILVCHQSFFGARFANGFQDPHGTDPSCVSHLKAVISGHIHSRQTIGNIWYPGTPYQNNFGESGEEKRIFSIDLSPEGYQILEEFDLNLPKFVVIEADSIANLKLPEPNSTTSYKIISKGDPGEIAAFWSDPGVKEFKSKVKKVVDAIVTDRGTIVLPGSEGTTKEEKLYGYIRSQKWRTATDKLCASAGAFILR